ncbi:hypothetical protein SAMN06265365_101576 [Tistlia consotensis]|uniref:Membrane transport protein MMPL domain-containing protein n=1 Tax=Tistlia consotensis USBA 355 TaxID=560819 RepID=A0A1Y6B6G7_9PROT|nr:MMPL family transporter [Tistlia consotensis]SME93295.1 hypothetical protein SAMN05428998_101575 [Tistlia consotensis USBA 355]SNR28581.1 hypothetical protein SAMN06265365_101576 [Tistlia consotensis]
MTPTARTGLARVGYACVAFSARRPLVVLLAGLLLTGATLWGVIGFLGIDTSTDDMISAEVPFRQHDIAFDKAFPQLRGLLVAVIDAPTPEQADAAASTLVGRMRQHPELFSQVFWPAGLPYLRQNGLLFLSESELQSLADRLAGAAPLLGSLAADPSLRGLADVLDQALTHRDEAGGPELAPVLDRLAEVAEAQAAGQPKRLSWRSLVSGQSAEGSEDTLGGDKRQFVLAQPVRDFGGLKPAAPAIAFLRQQGKALAAEGEITRLRLTGSPALDQEELDSVALGGKTAGILSFVGVTLLLFLGLRSPKVVGAATLALLIGLIWTAGCALLLVGYLNLLSVAFAVLFIGLGIDFGIHFSLRFLEESEQAPDRGSALAATGGAIAGALTLSAVSAAAGFLSFLPTDYLGLAQLGLISGAGMGCALIASFTVLPATLALLKPRARLPRLRRFGDATNGLVRRRRKEICIASLLLGLGCAALLPSLSFDFNPINLKDPKAESVATFRELAAEPNNSVYTLELLRPDLKAAVAEAARLEQLPEVGRVLTLQSFVPEDQDAKLDIVDAMASYLSPVFLSFPEAPPGDRERAAAVAKLSASLATAAGAGDDALAKAAGRLRAALAKLTGPQALTEYETRVFAGFKPLIDQLNTALEAKKVGLDDIPESLRSQWISADGRARIQAYSAHQILDNADLAHFADAVQAVAPDATGTPIIVTQASRTVVAAFIEASLIALVSIVAILLIVLRRLDDTLLVLAPLLLAALLTAAASVLFGLSFNFANVIVLPLLLGLGVSAGIHLVLRRREQGAGHAVMESSTPRAVLFSALTTLASFGSLALSGHRGMTSMGQLLTVSIIALLFSTLVVLPALLAWLHPGPGGSAGEAQR